MKKYIIFLLLSILISSCGPAFKITNYKDEFRPNTKFKKSTYIRVKGPTFFGLSTLYLAFEEAKSGNLASYYFIFYYTGERWAFMERIIIKVDGEITNYKPTTPPKTEVGGYAGVMERMTIKIPIGQINKLLKNNGKIRVIGSRLSFDFTFDSDLRNKLRQFFEYKD